MNVLVTLGLFLFVLSVSCTDAGWIYIGMLFVQAACVGAVYRIIAGVVPQLPRPASTSPKPVERYEEDISFLGPGKPDFMELLNRKSK